MWWNKKKDEPQAASRSQQPDWERHLRELMTEVPRDEQDAVVRYIATADGEGQILTVLSSMKLSIAMTPHRLRENAAGRPFVEDLATLPPEQLWRCYRVMTAHAHLGHPADTWQREELVEFADQLAYISGYYGGGPHVRSALPFERLRAALAVGVEDPDRALLDATLDVRAGYPGEREGLGLTLLPGYPDWAVANADAILSLLLGAPRGAAQHAVARLEPLPDDQLGVFAPALARLACHGSRPVQKQAEPLLLRSGRPGVEALQRLTDDDQVPVRERAFGLLAVAADKDPGLKDWLSAKAAADPSPSIVALGRRVAASEREVPTELPPYEPFDWHVPPSPELDAAIRAAVKDTCTQARVRREKLLARGRGVRPEILPDFSDDLLRIVHRDGPPREHLTVPGLSEASHGLMWQLQKESATPVAALLKIAYAIESSDRVLYMAERALYSDAARAASWDLRTIEDALHEIGVDSFTLLQDLALYSGSPAGWDPESVWPWVAAHDEELMQHYRQNGRGYRHQPEAFYDMVRALPRLTPVFRDGLIDLALRGPKIERKPARRLLGTAPGLRERAEEALLSSSAEERLQAAIWLGELREPESVPALERAAAKERSALVQDALIDDLEELGAPIDAYIGRGQLAKDAAKTMKKALPAALSWLSPDALPSVHWSDGEDVSRDILIHLLAQAVRGKTSRPGAVLRRICAQFDEADRVAFGRWLLGAWIAADTKVASVEEAEARGRQYEKNTWMAPTPEERYQLGYREALTTPFGSEVASRGVLAVVAACPSRGIADQAAGYIRTWYGTRAAQSKAMVELLANLDDPVATQHLLAIGTRFRTKSIQDAAREQTQELAERRGWTMTELADRTLPTAGFGDDGVLRLPYADERVFVARLLPDLTLQLEDSDGKKIKALPTPRQSDDAEQAAESKKQLAAARKELKVFPTLQRERLHQALCLGRGWPADDWERYLARHPLMRFLVARLVWLATSPDGTQVSFRPLDDGSYTDVEDNPVELDPEAEITLAYDGLVSAEVAEQWIEHLRDFDVVPLFPQFERAAYRLPEGATASRAITDFEGYVVDMFKLRGRSGKLGYERGEVTDGGWFLDYRRSYPELDLVAKIEFTGSPQPIEDVPVALTQLTFAPLNATNRDVTLESVPPVLLQESWNDLSDIASLGAFDPEWKTKVNW